ncbi:MAG: proline--tRNA ligase [Clostridia bacterium]|nr:proline--tRNA ligase [Clostridia bacterium]MDD4386617.1 proline--tRNA ligase [Clostridia bacterium]
MDDKNFVKELTKMDDNFTDWYTDVILKSELVDYAPVKGFMVIRPYGYALWENIQKVLDEKFKETGHKNAYFPLLIPESMLNKEKEHVAGFAPEVAWVTHGGDNKLQERLCIRPTSETIICTMYSKWIKSHRDLPLLINQWANVVRWEKTTRPFLRTTEFLWQEGHTLHSTANEAIEETLRMHKIYADFCEEYLAIPVIKGIKSEKERFAGAVSTYTIEALMHDGKALQSGTSHYLGTHFSKAFDIKFQNKVGKEEHAYQTSWGMSTRVIGGIIMTHGDDRGLKLPPNIAPIQVVIVPIAGQKPGVLNKVAELKKELSSKFRVELDDREEYSPGYKFNHWELRGVPVRVEIGPRDIENNNCIIFRRDTLQKETISLDTLQEHIEKLLVDIQQNMFEMAKENTENYTFEARSLEEYINIFETKQGFVKMMWCGDVACEDKIKDLTASTIRCIPFEEEQLDTKCAICGKDSKHMVYTARQY